MRRHLTSVFALQLVLAAACGKSETPMSTCGPNDFNCAKEGEPCSFSINCPGASNCISVKGEAAEPHFVSFRTGSGGGGGGGDGGDRSFGEPGVIPGCSGGAGGGGGASAGAPRRPV